MRVVAAEAEGPERERLWRRISAVAPLDRYQRRRPAACRSWSSPA